MAKPQASGAPRVVLPCCSRLPGYGTLCVMTMTTAAKATTYHNFIDGAWVPSVSGSQFENRNPAAADDLIGAFQQSTAADVARAIDAARRAFEHWRLVPAPRRAEIRFRAPQPIAEPKAGLARRLTG